MANKNKAKGTAAETRVVKFINSYEGLSAERLALHGAKDEGDIRVITKTNFEIRLEVKSGKQTQNPSRADLTNWLNQTRQEERNSGITCFLVIARYGKSPKDYDVYKYTHNAFDHCRNHYYLDDFINEYLK